MTPAQPEVSVIIACHDAQDSLARAIGSALSEPETAEVIVVDDASTDSTLSVARSEATQDARVKVLSLATNAGPAVARNRGLDVATAPYVAVLDSDDFFLPGRLRLLLSARSSELAADNVVFVQGDTADSTDLGDWPDVATDFESLSLADFVRGNLRRRGTARGELGFLKPLMSKRFLDRNKLRYDPSMRLGEDYDLYVRMFLAGARMSLTRHPGYAAIVRPGSLSARHATGDLEILRDRIESHLGSPGTPRDVATAMRHLLRDVRQKHDHRKFLDLRRAEGPASAIRFAMGGWGRPGPIATQIARDKLRLNADAGNALPQGGVRLLLDVDRTET